MSNKMNVVLTPDEVFEAISAYLEKRNMKVSDKSSFYVCYDGEVQTWTELKVTDVSAPELITQGPYR